MKKYGIEFEPFAARRGWFVSKGFSPGPKVDYLDNFAKLETKVETIHRKFKPSGDLVFFGCFQPEAKIRQHSREGSSQILPMRIFLISDMDMPHVAKEFQLGSHAASYLGDGLVENVYEVLKELQDIAKFVPTFLDTAGLHARFVPAIDRAQAASFWKAYESFGCPGIAEGWISGNEDLGETGEEIEELLVREQKFRLWWD